MNTITEEYLSCYKNYINQDGLENPIIYKNRKIHRINITINDQDRFFLFVPSVLEESKSIIFYHGSRSTAYEMVFITTNLLENFEGNIIFGQAYSDTPVLEPYIHPKFKDISFGDFYFEIRDYLPQFTVDLEYTKYLIDYLNNSSNINFIGHSNGGIFGLLLAVHIKPGLLNSITSHMGGIGWDSNYFLDFSLIDQYDKLPKIIIYTGEYDEYKEPSEQARDIFMNYDFAVDFYVEPKSKHEYHSGIVEPIILEKLKI